MLNFNKTPMVQRVFTAIALHLTLVGNAGADTKFIDDVTVFDSTGNGPYKADVIVKDGRFLNIAPSLSAPRGATVVDGSGVSLLPGLIDVHVHWRGSRSEISTALLEHGITTATDFHSSPDSFAAKRKWHDQLISPHVAYTARIAPPGGHGADWGDETMTRLVASPEEARAVMGYLDAYQPDVIKVFADGWRYGNDKEDNDISLHALKEITLQAKKRGWPVVTHTVTVDGGKRAALGNVTAVVHAIQNEPASDELPGLMVGHNVYYAPTLAVYEMRPDKIARYSEAQIAAGKARQQYSKQNLQTFMAAGVHLALGTDSGIASTPYGESSVHELELMTNFGVSAKDAIIAGTKGSASVLGVAEDRGTIEIGKRADFVLVDGKPWEQVSDYRNIKSVYVDGKHVVQDGKLLGTQGPDLPLAIPATALIDDFERIDGKTQYGTLRKQDIDFSFPRSHVLMQSKAEKPGDNQFLSVSIALENKPNPKAGVIFPLSDGSFYPVDASAFNGVAFDINAKPGTYIVTLDSYSGQYKTTIDVPGGWQTLVLPFDSFKGDKKVDMGQLKSVAISVAGEGEETYWMELDNVKFTQ